MDTEVCDLTAREMVAAIQRRELSSRELVAAHLNRIDRVNGQVNAVVSLVPERALAEAADADRRLASGEAVGPLHGLPVAHKDTHSTAGLRTTFGSRVMVDHVPDADDLAPVFQ